MKRSMCPRSKRRWSNRRSNRLFPKRRWSNRRSNRLLPQRRWSKRRSNRLFPQCPWSKRRSIVLLVVVAIVGAGLPLAEAQSVGGRPTLTAVLYVPPVSAAVIDPFRPPAHIGAPGNRGLEYGDTDGMVVGAAAAGLVGFAGPVAGRNVVTIDHADGLRTTYTGLVEVWVVKDQWVTQNTAIALASSSLHFGALVKSHYLDPQILIDASQAPTRVRLLPPPDPG